MDRLYTHQRRLYPYFFGGALWLAWLASILLGSGRFDAAGQVVGTDYLLFYTSGLTLIERDQANLYNFEVQNQRYQTILGVDPQEDPAYKDNVPLNLPFLAWLYAPFASASYIWSFILWSFFGLLLFWTSLRLLGNGSVFPLALTFVPVFSAISFGQNAFVSLFLLTAVYALWTRDKRWVAGFLLAFLLYKPQLVLGVGFLWLLNWRKDWQALGGFAIGVMFLAGLMGILMPEATAAYFVFSRDVLPNLAEWGKFPVWHMHHPRGFLQLLLPATVADVLWVGSSLFGVWLFWRLWQREENHVEQQSFWFAGAILLTLWTTPHAMIYDWTLLLLPAVLLWQARPDWHTLLRRLFIAGWIAYLLSGPLTAGQLAISPVAVQVSVIFYAWALWSLIKMTSLKS
ncbi:MAG: glycosyltransferase family 87 protein [Anaerolineae bacterium]